MLSADVLLARGNRQVVSHPGELGDSYYNILPLLSKCGTAQSAEQLRVVTDGCSCLGRAGCTAKYRQASTRCNSSASSMKGLRSHSYRLCDLKRDQTAAAEATRQVRELASLLSPATLTTPVRAVIN